MPSVTKVGKPLPLVALHPLCMFPWLHKRPLTTPYAAIDVIA